MTLDQINQIDGDKAGAVLLECCGSQAWVSRMVSGRPYSDVNQLIGLAEGTWWSLTSKDWLEAFSQHPRIGGTGQVSKWSAQEQSRVGGEQGQVMQKLRSLNEAYFEKFGWIFIVCATGKSASEMLTILEHRISNEPGEELSIAAGEQSKITILRIGKLLAE